MATEYQLQLVTLTQRRDYVLRVDDLVILPKGSQVHTPISMTHVAIVFFTEYDPLAKSATVVCQDIKLHENELEESHKRLLNAGWDAF